VAIAQSDSEAASFKAGFQIERPEHPHSILGHGIFLTDDIDVPEAQALGERFHNTMVWNRLMGFCCGRRWHLRQFLPCDFSVVGN
jgi:hypothetical protein